MLLLAQIRWFKIAAVVLSLGILASGLIFVHTAQAHEPDPSKECPAGYDLDGSESSCTKTTTTRTPIKPQCESGFKLVTPGVGADVCQSTTRTPIKPQCESGFKLVTPGVGADVCQSTTRTPIKPQCESGFKLVTPGVGADVCQSTTRTPIKPSCNTGTLTGGECVTTTVVGSPTCSTGTRWGNTCVDTVVNTASYRCTSGTLTTGAFGIPVCRHTAAKRCPAGYRSLFGGCYHPTTYHTTLPSCPSSYSTSGNTCVRYSSVRWYCTASQGTFRSPNNCVTTAVVGSPKCAADETRQGNNCVTTATKTPTYPCSGTKVGSDCVTTATKTPTYPCSGTKVGSDCVTTATKTPTYPCSGTKVGSDCVTTATKTPTYPCSGTKVGSDCVTTATQTRPIKLSCYPGHELKNNKCVHPTVSNDCTPGDGKHSHSLLGTSSYCHAGSHSCPIGQHATSEDHHGHVSGCHSKTSPAHRCPIGQHATSEDHHGHVLGCHPASTFKHRHYCHNDDEHPLSTNSYGHVSGCHTITNTPHECPDGQGPTSKDDHGHVTGCHTQGECTNPAPGEHPHSLLGTSYCHIDHTNADCPRFFTVYNHDKCRPVGPTEGATTWDCEDWFGTPQHRHFENGKWGDCHDDLPDEEQTGRICADEPEDSPLYWCFDIKRAILDDLPNHTVGFVCSVEGNAIVGWFTGRKVAGKVAKRGVKEGVGLLGRAFRWLRASDDTTEEIAKITGDIVDGVTSYGASFVCDYLVDPEGDPEPQVCLAYDHSGGGCDGNIPVVYLDLESGEAPPAPSGVSAGAGDGEIMVSWSAGAPAGAKDGISQSDSTSTAPAPIGYRVQWKLSTQAWSDVNDWDHTEDLWGGSTMPTSHTITGLANGSAYDVRVTAFNFKGFSTATTAQATPTVPAYKAPASLVATVRGYAAETQHGQDHVDRWNGALEGLCVEDFPGVSAMTSAQAQGHADAYSSSRWSPVVAELKKAEAANCTIAAKPEPKATAPDPASGLSVAAGDKQIAVSWTASATAPAAGFGYRVQWKLVTQAWGDAAVGSEDLDHGSDLATSHTITGLSNGSAYDVRVAAFNADGVSAWITGQTTPAAPAVSAPDPASGLSVAAGDKQIAVSWSASATAPAAGFGYRVQWKLVAQAWGDAAVGSEDLDHGSDLATSHTITGLVNGSAYDVRVAAFNADGVSDWITGQTTPTAPKPEAKPSLAFDSVSCESSGSGWVITATWSKTPETLKPDIWANEAKNRGHRGRQTAVAGTSTTFDVPNAGWYQVGMQAKIAGNKKVGDSEAVRCR
ncbi:fibronectin type III domain-containing protein [Candidatus Poriferisocius sp.]|uniref:fibronectin type III domain-containing protein n=1 Tax=Candidatus Poriferisocius sp. TaxID=3101276 RepID=UPI003B59973F